VGGDGIEPPALSV